MLMKKFASSKYQKPIIVSKLIYYNAIYKSKREDRMEVSVPRIFCQRTEKAKKVL